MQFFKLKVEIRLEHVNIDERITLIRKCEIVYDVTHWSCF